VRFRVQLLRNLCVIFGGQNDVGTGLSPSAFVRRC
jgi:hypothetical protein